MPELKHKQEINTLVIKLMLGASDKEAEKKIKEEIVVAYNTFSRRVDNLMHNYKQIDKLKSLGLFFTEKGEKITSIVKSNPKKTWFIYIIQFRIIILTLEMKKYCRHSTLKSCYRDFYLKALNHDIKFELD